MFTFCALPTVLVRLAVEALLLLVALVVVLPKHRRAGLIMATGALMDLVVSLSIPALELVGLGVWSRYQVANTSGPGDPDLIVLVFLFLPLIAPLAQAFNLMCFLVSVVMLANRLPNESVEREW